MENPYNKLILGHRMKQQSKVEAFHHWNFNLLFLFKRYEESFCILGIIFFQYLCLTELSILELNCSSWVFSSRAEEHPYDLELFRCPDVELCVIDQIPGSDLMIRKVPDVEWWSWGVTIPSSHSWEWLEFS